MRNGLYRHSVWIDVFGVALFGAVLLGGAGYLLLHAEGISSRMAVEPSQQTRQARVPQRAHRGPTGARPPRGGLRSSSASGLLLSEERGQGERSSVPFSEQWRERATPRLTGSGGTGSSGGGSLGSSGGSATGGREAAGSGSGPSNPAIALARPSEAGGARKPDGAGKVGPDWRAKARRLSGRIGALSRELGQMAQASSDGEEAASSGSSPEASKGEASSNDRDVPNPPNVPIDDHLHWLLMAGLLWGVWQLTGGS